LPWNDLELVGRVLEKRHEEIAAIITEPIMCNNGCILPKEGFLSGLRELCNKYGVTLIFDEVITGFRVGLGGAQSYYGVTPDLSIFAKAMGSGYPISAIVGKHEWMELVAAGKVIHAGTMNAGNPTVAAALATIEVLEQEMPYDRMHRLGRKLMQGLQRAAADAAQDLSVQGLGPMFVTYFGVSQPLSDYRDTLGTNKAKLGRFVAGLHDAGVRVIGRGLWYISAAHTEAEINQAIEVASRVLHDMNSA